MEARDKVWQNEKLIQTLFDGGVVIMPTDTVYGFVCRAENPVAVSRVYTIRKRDTERPCIILISSMSELEKFYIDLSEEQREALLRLWPAPVSVRLECQSDKFVYLHRGTNSLVFRIPSPLGLHDLLKAVGPIIAPSANPEGLPVAKNIAEAKEYFGDLVDMYVDGGEIVSAPSKIIKLSTDGTEEILRE